MTSKEKIKEIEDFIDFLEEKCIITSSDTAKTRLNLNTILKDLEKLERYENNMPQLIEGHEKLQSSEDWGDIADSAFLIRTALEKMGVIEED